MSKTIQIPLTQGKHALVDYDDLHLVANHKWHIKCERRRTCYALRQAGKHKVSMHRTIMQCLEGFEIDHRNGDGLDNRRSNLRVCTHIENSHNRRPNKNGTSRYKGVSWRTKEKKWGVQITLNRRRSFLGYYKSEVKAAKAYDDDAKKYFGDFVWLNFPSRLKRRNIYRWLLATNGRIFNVTFIKRTDGLERSIVARVGVKKYEKGNRLQFNPRRKKLIVVFDLSKNGYKCIPIDGIEAVTCKGKTYRVD
jgi:hypothetical protein